MFPKGALGGAFDPGPIYAWVATWKSLESLLMTLIFVLGLNGRVIIKEFCPSFLSILFKDDTHESVRVNTTERYFVMRVRWF